MLEPDSADYGEQLRLKIDSLAEERRSYASKLNDTLPIFRLPPDILCTIFLLYKRDALFHHLEPSTRYLYSWNNPGFPSRLIGRPWCYVPWVAISYVCRRFRDMTLDLASFWNTLCMTSVPWTQELIQRSKQAPLSVFHSRALPALAPLARGQEVTLVCLRLALAHNTRIQTLELLDFHLGSLSWHGEVFSEVLDPESFPNLRNLKITLSGSQNYRTLSHFGNQPPTLAPTNPDLLRPLVQSLIQNALAPLRSLHLSGFGRAIWSQSSSSSSLMSLSRLIIEACADATLTTVLSTLEKLPQLQELVIRDCQEIDSFKLDGLPPNEGFMGIPLPFLRSFTLSGVLGVGGRLLESLILPFDVKLSLEVGRPPHPALGYGNGAINFGQASLPERFEALLRVLEPYFRHDSSHESLDNYITDKFASRFRGKSMLFANGPGAICFALSDVDDYNPPCSSFGSEPGTFLPISHSSYRSPAPNGSFKFTADLSRQADAAASISDALLDRVRSSSLLDNVEHVTLREFHPGRHEVCSWPTARWIQTIVHIPKLKTLDADLNYPCMALLSNLLDVRDQCDGFNTLSQRTFYESVPPSATPLQTLYLHRADWRIITNVPPPAGAHPANGMIPPGIGPFGAAAGPIPMGPVPILPPPLLHGPMNQSLSPPQQLPIPPFGTNSGPFPPPGNVGPGGPPNPQMQQPAFQYNPLAFHLAPAQQASSHINFNTVVLFGREMPSVEGLYDVLIRPRSIIEVLQGRKGAGLPLKTLILRRSQMTEESLKKLKEVVSEVDWDDRKIHYWKRDLWKKALGSMSENSLSGLDALVGSSRRGMGIDSDTLSIDSFIDDDMDWM
ncbi:hypothetical protein DL96DRAFT_212235 [Flagelloscypha sp. PMI_526]|nr:hypothetical protein DL96DRAFT_212235 [Flagelloscypha sp. PMI_526]